MFCFFFPLAAAVASVFVAALSSPLFLSASLRQGLYLLPHFSPRSLLSRCRLPFLAMRVTHVAICCPANPLPPYYPPFFSVYSTYLCLLPHHPSPDCPITLSCPLSPPPPPPPLLNIQARWLVFCILNSLSPSAGSLSLGFTSLFISFFSLPTFFLLPGDRL